MVLVAPRERLALPWDSPADRDQHPLDRGSDIVRHHERDPDVVRIRTRPRLTVPPVGDVVLGGIFSNIAGTACNNLATYDYDLGTWFTLGTFPNDGTNNRVRAITSYQGELIIGGNFTQAGGASANRIARWDGFNWSTFGTGADNTVVSLAVVDDKLYVGGNLTDMDGVSVNRLACWDGSTWTDPSTSFNQTIWAMCEYRGKLVVGGTFTAPETRIAQWDGLSWTGFGTGITLGQVRSLYARGSNLYAGGSFQDAGGIAVFAAARWDGAAWNRLGTVAAPGPGAFSHAIDRFGNNPAYGGTFASLGAPLRRLTQWNGSAWAEINEPNASLGDVFAHGDTFVICGTGLTSIDGVTSHGAAYHDGTSWRSMGTSGTFTELIALGAFVA